MPSHVSINVKVGCDPEIFVAKDNKIISCHDLLPGTKEHPHPVDYGAIQVDGVAAEVNIKPASNSSHFAYYLLNVMNELKSRLPNHTLKIQPAFEFPLEYLRSLPDDVKRLGCNPDFNAWTGEKNDPPNGNATRLRTAAGHLHIGWTEGQDINDPFHFKNCCRVTQQLDYYIGLPSMAWDNDSRRRTLYGKAGAFRPKPYGVEYRTPSNMWLRYEDLWPWLFEACKAAVTGMNTGDRVYMPDIYGDKARQVIDGNDLEFISSSAFKKEMYPKTGMSFPRWKKG